MSDSALLKFLQFGVNNCRTVFSCFALIAPQKEE